MVVCICETFILERCDSGKVDGNIVALQMLALVVIILDAARLQISPRVADIFAIKGTPNAARLQISPRVGSKKIEQNHTLSCQLS